MVSDGTEGAARVADVLLAFIGRDDAVGVTTLARELDLSKAVVHRILRTLVDRKLLEADIATRGYRLGQAAAAIGARAMRESRVREIAMPRMRELRAVTGETSTLSVRVPGGRVYLDQVESLQEVKMTVELGRRFPLHAGSSSRAILAFLPKDEQDSVIAAGLDPLTSETVIDPERLREALETVRSTGIARSYGERQVGAASVACPVFDLDGQVVAAISVCGPRVRLSDETMREFGALVRSASDQVSVALGWRGGLPTP